MAISVQRVLDYIRQMVMLETGESVDVVEYAYDNGYVVRDEYTGEYTIPVHKLQAIAEDFGVDVNVYAIA